MGNCLGLTRRTPGGPTKNRESKKKSTGRPIEVHQIHQQVAVQLPNGYERGVGGGTGGAAGGRSGGTRGGGGTGGRSGGDGSSTGGRSGGDGNSGGTAGRSSGGDGGSGGPGGRSGGDGGSGGGGGQQPRRSQRPHEAPDVKVVRALFDYDPQVENDLQFKSGDKLILLNDKISQDWWYAKNLRTSEAGYIPRNFVIDDDDCSLKAQEWFFEIDHRTADRLLMLPGNANGTFLVRCCADGKNFALSVRHYDNSIGDFAVKHYKIHTRDNGSCYISAKRTFSHLFALLAHYKETGDGLCCRLEHACPRTRPVVAFRELEVQRTGVTLIKKLGAGFFGEVWEGKWRKVDVAVKMLKPGKMTRDEFLSEARLMHELQQAHKLQHAHLVQLMGVCTEQEPMYIITELMTKGSLLDYLHEDAGMTLDLKILLDMAAQICSGMAYLEKGNFVHRDLRAANILVSDNNLVKVADFGLARAIHTDETYGDDEDVYQAHEGAKFPVKWTAPEAAFDRKFSIKSDVWSFGVLLWELCTFGITPYPGIIGSEVLNMLRNGYRMPKPSHSRLVTPDSLYAVMCDCWNKRPEIRPTFASLFDLFDDYFISTEPHYKS